MSSNIRNIHLELTGKTALLMHRDNIEWADTMHALRTDPKNEEVPKPGDDRSPAWRWVGSIYHDGKNIALPQENILRALMEGGAMVSTGVGKKTYKAQTQSGLMITERAWTLLVGGKPIRWADIEPLMKETKFTDHLTRARALGFDLMTKRARVGMAKHIRVRPVFAPGWQLRGDLKVWDDQLDIKTLQAILDKAGEYKGLCEWRPGGRTPGPYGTFDAVVS